MYLQILFTVMLYLIIVYGIHIFVVRRQSTNNVETFLNPLDYIRPNYLIDNQNVPEPSFSSSGNLMLSMAEIQELERQNQTSSVSNNADMANELRSILQEASSKNTNQLDEKVEDIIGSNAMESEFSSNYSSADFGGNVSMPESQLKLNKNSQSCSPNE